MSTYDFGLAFFALGFGVAPLLLSVLVLHFLMPKAVLERYWKVPHFRELELALFTGTIYAPMRTVMFMWLFLFPKLGAKRKIENLTAITPKWYRVGGIILCLWTILTLVGVFSIGTGLHIYWKINGMI